MGACACALCGEAARAYGRAGGGVRVGLICGKGWMGAGEMGMLGRTWNMGFDCVRK